MTKIHRKMNVEQLIDILVSNSVSGAAHDDYGRLVIKDKSGIVVLAKTRRTENPYLGIQYWPHYDTPEMREAARAAWFILTGETE